MFQTSEWQPRYSHLCKLYSYDTCSDYFSHMDNWDTHSYRYLKDVGLISLLSSKKNLRWALITWIYRSLSPSYSLSHLRTPGDLWGTQRRRNWVKIMKSTHGLYYLICLRLSWNSWIKCKPLFIIHEWLTLSQGEMWTILYFILKGWSLSTLSLMSGKNGIMNYVYNEVYINERVIL